MRNVLLSLCLLFVAVLSTGCAKGLSATQQREYAAFEADGVLIVEKKPNKAALLGIGPGLGSFYVREPGYGIANLMLWPLSITWDPISGKNGAMTINYDATKAHLKRQEEKEVKALDEQLSSGAIDNTQYLVAKRQVEKKYIYE